MNGVFARGLCIAAIVLGVVGADTSSAAADENHVYNPVLSLTGSCTTSKIDEVPDPGCPTLHPPKPFELSQAAAVTTDEFGDIFVSVYGKTTAEGAEGRIDIFSPAGVYLTEIPDPAGPRSLAVDSEGNLYVFEHRPALGGKVVRYEPTEYEPGLGKLAYGSPPVSLLSSGGAYIAVAIDRANGHLFVNVGTHVVELGSATEGNPVIDETIGQGVLTNSEGPGIAVDAEHNRLYASNCVDCVSGGTYTHAIEVFELESPHTHLETIDGSTTPAGKFEDSLPTVTADEGTGNFFVFDGEGGNRLYEFAEDGSYLSTIPFGFQGIIGEEIAVDNGKESPNGGANLEGRYLFVPSHPSGIGHLFAFGPYHATSPEISSLSAADVTRTDARIEATINPGNLQTTWVLYNGPAVVAEGTLPAGSVPVGISSAVSGLLPETEYKFRLVASNSAGKDEAETTLVTYPLAPTQTCPNEAFRTGFSTVLPDCRAYELVTPPSTNARTPAGVDHFGIYFLTRETSPVGDKVSFLLQGGSLPGSETTGSWSGDPYLSSRGAEGWTTASTGPTGFEAVAPLAGSNSPDQGYSFWNSGGRGSAAVGGKPTSYVRYPDGHSALIGRGSATIDPRAEGRLISESGGHIIFTSEVQLEPQAPTGSTVAVYDRTADEVTHVVSLLPNNAPPSPGEDAIYMGSSSDGRGVAFKIGPSLYLRVDNAQTFEIGEDVTFEGVAEGGSRVFYLQGGQLKAFDVAEKSVTTFSSATNTVPVNVSPDGSAAYFVSTSVLTSKKNPTGAKPVPTGQNLYLSKEGTISFVGTLTELDVTGDTSGNDVVEGLGLWTTAVGPSPYGAPGRLAEDPSRTTPDGTAIVFESRAKLTGYDAKEHTQVYRYDSLEQVLQCLSCNPTGSPPVGRASLQSVSQGIVSPEPFSSYAVVENLRADGRRAFFQTTEPLSLEDTDGLQDVYEWEAQGVGSCSRATGCVYLISSGHSARTDYLYAVSESGNDVFFRTSDLLLPADAEEAASIYDARVEGGFPEPTAATSCEGEACRPQLAVPPSLTAPDSSKVRSHGKHCPKGKRRVKRHGKVRCIARHRHHRKAHRGQKGAGK